MSEGAGDVGPAILEDVLVDGLKATDLFLAWSPFFRRVTLRGRLGQIKVNRFFDAVERDPQALAAFDQARARFYADTDWALDIREAQFSYFGVAGVPTSLIRRDPTTQAVVRREKALDPSRRRKLPAWNDHWPMVIDMAMSDAEPDVLLVASKAAKKARLRRLLEGIENLRELGLAEPG